MPIKRINPPELYDAVRFGFSHAVESQGTRLLHCAGQVAWDKEHNPVGEGDRVAQARQALQNLKTVLAAANATPADLVRIRTYVVDHTPDKIEAVGAALAEFYGDATPAANTWIGVQALALPGMMIEIEATAAID